jgi:putative DNA methylase
VVGAAAVGGGAGRDLRADGGRPIELAGPVPTEKAQEKERKRLFHIIEDLVLWENTTNEEVLERARDAIWESWRRTCAENIEHPRAKELFDRRKLPAFHDPFAGGGALPLEAQRLGLEAYASDLNPVAVLINKAMIEIPPRFAGRPPVHPGETVAGKSGKGQGGLFKREWKGAEGLAEDVRYYGQWMRDEAEKRIGHLYPKIEVTAEMAKERPDLKPYVGRKLTVIAWLWARTVKSPNPAFANVDVPLVSTFMLSTKAGKEAYVECVIEESGYRFNVHCHPVRERGEDNDTWGRRVDAFKKQMASLSPNGGTKLARGANFRCLMSGTPISGDYIKAEGKAGRMGTRLMGIVAEGHSARTYMAPIPEHEAVAKSAGLEWWPDGSFVEDARAFTPCIYGIKEWRQLFTTRQLAALTIFSDLTGEAMSTVREHAVSAGLPDAGKLMGARGSGAGAYAEAIGVYLAFCVDKMTDTNTCLCSWQVNPPRLRATFGRQALPMVWDYAEANVFGDAAGDFGRCVRSLTEVLDKGGLNGKGTAQQQDAQALEIDLPRVFSTDPPYYDNVPYADLSDFFYVWLRRSMRPVFPNLFATLAVPKAEELVATRYRHGGKEKAEAFFLDGMTQAMHRLAQQSHPVFPVTIYYAFKQAESANGYGTASTGWETFLGAVIGAGFAVSGTWPMRSELATRNRGRDANALASSIVLVCRARPANVPTATRREFVAALKAELPQALTHLQRGNIAPVDLAQAAIGPGMAVYTRYAKVLDAAGNAMTVREALALINEVLDEALAEQEGDFDADTRWALAWFEQFGFNDGPFGVAEILSKAKNTSVSGLEKAGLLSSKGGHVGLLRPDELPAAWSPATDARLTIWEIVHYLTRALDSGYEAAGELLAQVRKVNAAKADAARELAYRLYALCERKKRAREALAYNSLVVAWPDLMRLAEQAPVEPAPRTGDMFR